MLQVYNDSTLKINDFKQLGVKCSGLVDKTSGLTAFEDDTKLKINCGTGLKIH